MPSPRSRIIGAGAILRAPGERPGRGARRPGLAAPWGWRPGARVAGTGGWLGHPDRSPAGGFMTVVETAYGKLRGTEIADGVLAWRGVPYAAPPVGGLRLRPPAPPRPWAGVRDALAYGNRSLQPDLVAEPQGPPAPPADEDCLY